jgi:ADP-ribosyl-[dinitrogen reductase] hydrolase
MESGNRALGCLMGLAVGDAIGTTREFEQEPASIPQQDIVGGGPFHLEPGQVTDDTQMATCLASSLAEREGYDANDIAARYVAWLPHAFDVGATTAAALSHVVAGESPNFSGERVMHANAKGNGALMRVAPIAAYHALHTAADARGRVIEDAITDARITHAASLCVHANAAFSLALYHSMLCTSAPPDPIGVVRTYLEPMESNPLGAHESDAAMDLLFALRNTHTTELGALNVGRGGYVLDTFKFAFWLLQHASSYEDCVLRAANYGGDTDTNAAVAGALWGAVHGFDSIPQAWVDKVLNACADDDVWGYKPTGVSYHPKTMVEAFI